MKVLVTGATGFTGGALCKRLVSLGYQVRALARDEKGKHLLDSLGVEVFKLDLCEPSSLDSAVKGVDIVYHIAALYRQQGVSSEKFWKVNAESVDHLMKSSLKAGVHRVVHCSTGGVHGHVHPSPGTEDSPYNPGDEYQESKLAGEKIARRVMEEGKLAVTIFRPTGIYGPGDLRFLKLFRAIQKKRFFMLGSGEVNYHLIFIDDLIDGIMLCGTQDHAIGKTYILGGREATTLNQLVRMITEELGVKSSSVHIPLWPMYAAGYLCEIFCKPFGFEPPLYRRRIDFFKKNRAFDISKAKSELGFLPKIELKEGIHRTASWYKDNGYL